MRAVFDTHVHLYPVFPLAELFDAASAHFARVAPDAEARVLCLTEREGQAAFADLARGALAASPWTVHATPEPAALEARAPDGRHLLLLAGRQLVSAERLEVLALGVDLRLADGAPVRELLASVRAAGALPVLPWGLGKWWGARGRLVRNLLDELRPGAAAFADTALLPALLPRPPVLRDAARSGFRTLAGTDPLPRPGEHRLAGSYGVECETGFDPAHPASSALALLANPTQPLRLTGRRGTLGSLFSRAR